MSNLTASIVVLDTGIGLYMPELWRTLVEFEDEARGGCCALETRDGGMEKHKLEADLRVCGQPYHENRELRNIGNQVSQPARKLNSAFSLLLLTSSLVFPKGIEAEGKPDFAREGRTTSRRTTTRRRNLHRQSLCIRRLWQQSMLCFGSVCVTRELFAADLRLQMQAIHHTIPWCNAPTFLTGPYGVRRSGAEAGSTNNLRMQNISWEDEMYDAKQVSAAIIGQNLAIRQRERSEKGTHQAEERPCAHNGESRSTRSMRVLSGTLF